MPNRPIGEVNPVATAVRAPGPRAPEDPLKFGTQKNIDHKYRGILRKGKDLKKI